MNCQDIAQLIDERDVGTLSDAERHGAQAHCANCVDCARDWKLYGHLVGMAVPPAPPGLAASCRVLVAAGATTSRPASRRVILFGTLLAVGAAAGMLVVGLSDPEAPGMEPEVIVAAAPVPDIVPVSSSMPVEPDVQDTSPVAVPASSSSGDEPVAGEGAGSFTVLVVRDRDDAAGTEAGFAGDSVHAVLVDRLHAVPGLVLVAEPPADYRVTLRSRALPANMAHVADVTVHVEADAAEPGGGWRSLHRHSISSLRGGESSVVEPLIETLRLRVFPFDPSLQQELLARVTSPGAHRGLRQSVLRNLLEAASSRSLSVDEAVLRAAIDLAGPQMDAQFRLQVWRMLEAGSVRHPDMARALLDLARWEPDEDLRLHALAQLAKDYADNAAVAALLESVAAQDGRAVARAAASRGQMDDAAWHEYVTGTLKDTNVPAAQRLDLLHLITAPGGTRDVVKFLEDEVVESVVGLLLQDGAQSGAQVYTSGLVNALASSRHPAAVDVLIDVVRVTRGDSTNPVVLMRETALINLWTTHREDPRARRLFEEMAASEPNDQWRQFAADVLEALKDDDASAPPSSL